MTTPLEEVVALLTERDALLIRRITGADDLLQDIRTILFNEAETSRHLISRIDQFLAARR